MKSASPPDILRKIIADKTEEIESAKKNCREFAKIAKDLPLPRNFAKALTKENSPAIIAEVKKASPSKGIIAKDFDPIKQALAYENAGADAISILTEKNYFLGSVSYLDAISREVSLPLLRKDFIVHESQIYESRAHGADSFLLIAAAISTQQAKDYIALGRELGMEPLFETHNEEELECAIECGAKIIGVNSRNLRTFEVKLEVALELVRFMPNDCIPVAESGITKTEDIILLFNAGYSAFLIGETLMKNSHEQLKMLLASFKDIRRKQAQNRN